MKNVSIAILAVASMFVATGCIASSDGSGQSEMQPALKMHEQGMPNAKVEVVLYEDLACPYAHELYPRLVQLMQAYPMDVKLTFRHFPLSFEKDALPAAEAVECASEVGGEGAFWDMHDRILSTSETSTGINYVEFAKEIGIDGMAFATCLQSGKYKLPVQTAHDNAYDQGIESSPTMVFNGTVVLGAVSYDKLEEAYESASRAR